MDLVSTLATGSLAGLLAHLGFYEVTHRPGFPECGRYTIGGLTVLLVFVLVNSDERARKDVFAALAGAGLGVLLGRFARGMLAS